MNSPPTALISDWDRLELDKPGRSSNLSLGRGSASHLERVEMPLSAANLWPRQNYFGHIHRALPGQSSTPVHSGTQKTKPS